MSDGFGGPSEEEEEFVIPVSERDLLSSGVSVQEDAQKTYRVRVKEGEGDDADEELAKVLSVPASQQLTMLHRKLRADALSITRHAVFDPLFCIVNDLHASSGGDLEGSQPQQRLEARLIAILVECAEDVMRAVKSVEMIPVQQRRGSQFGASTSSQSLLDDTQPLSQSQQQQQPSTTTTMVSNLSASEAFSLRNAVKMSVFLLAWAVRKAEINMVETASATASTVIATTGVTKRGRAKRGGRGGRGAAAKRAAASRGNAGGDSGDEDGAGDDGDGGDGKGISGWDSDEVREKVLSVMLDVLEADQLLDLWKPAKPEDEFLALFSKTASLFLENSANCKVRSIKRCISVIMGTLIRRFDQTANVVTTALHLLHKFEHVPVPLAEAFEVIANEFGGGQAVGRAMREIAQLDSEDLAREGTLAKNAATFLVEVTERMPKLILPSVSVLLPHLEHGESYTLRNGIVQSIGIIALHVFKDGQQQQQQQQQQTMDSQQVDVASTCDTLIGVLESRILDVSSYSRAKVLQTMIPLFMERAIPLKRFLPIAEKTAGRLCDKTSQVRKNAMQLLRTIIQFNPYAANISVALFRTKLEQCAKIFEQIEQSSDENNSNEQDGDDLLQDEVAGAELARKIPAESVTELFQGTPFDPKGIPDETLILHLRRFFTWAKQGLQFAELLVKAVVLVSQLLSSKATTDVLEAIDFLVTARQMGVESSEAGVRNMLALVWTTEPAVKESLVTAYNTLYFSLPKPKMVADNLISLVSAASPAELVSLEKLLHEMYQQNRLTPELFGLLFDFVVCTDDSLVTKEMRRNALKVISLVSACNPSFMQARIGDVVAVALNDKWYEDVPLATSACVMLEKRREENADEEKKPVKSENQPPAKIQNKNTSESNSAILARLPSDHELFQRLEMIIAYDPFPDEKACIVPYDEWAAAAEHAINAVTLLAENPDHVCERALKKLHKKVFGGKGEKLESVSTDMLARLLFVAGHCAVKLLAHLEVVGKHMDNAMRERNAKAQEEERMKKRKSGKAQTKVKKEQSSKRVSDAKNADESMDAPATVPNMDGEGVPVEESEAEFMQGCAERALITTDLLGEYTKLILAVCRDEGGMFSSRSKLLKASAALAFCKYICVGGEAFCKEQMPLFATMLERTDEPGIRASLVVAFGDLCARYPNSTESWTSFLFNRLRDVNVSVRRNTVAVLAHLILNDVIKLKGQISGLALCLEDSDPRVVGIAQLFFNELSKKSNAIYNILPDVISSLSAECSKVSGKSGAEAPEPLKPHTAEITVTRDMFKRITQFLFAFLQKERQFEALLEKLCARFKTTTDGEGLAFCLSLLTYNDKCIKKLAELSPLYWHALQEDSVYESFTAIISKAKKFAKAEMKAAIDDLEAKIEAARSGASATAGDAAAAAAAEEVGMTTAAEIEAEVTQAIPKTVQKAPPTRKRAVTTVKKSSKAAAPTTVKRGKRKTAAVTKRKRNAYESDESDEDNVEDLLEDDFEEAHDDEDNEDDEQIIKRRGRKSGRNNTRRKKRSHQSSDEEEDDS